MQDDGRARLDGAGGERKLGFWMCTALVVGNTIGIGIFVLPASLAPYGFNATIGWAITVAGCLALAQVFSRLARDLPNADGPYGYIRSTLGEMPAFAAIWCYWVSTWISNAAIATGVVGYLIALFPDLAVVRPPLLALGLVWLFVAVNMLGVRAGGGVQVVTTARRRLPMLVVVGLGAWLLVDRPSAYVQQLPTTPLSLGQVMAASTIALFAMLGLESATVPAGKVKDPGRTIPRATLVGALLTAVIYIIVSTVPMLLIPQEQLARSGTPFVALLDQYLGQGNGRWLALFVVISGLGALNGWTLLVGELTRTMAANGVLPAVLSRNNRFGAPGLPLLVTGLLASAMVGLSYSKSMVDAFTLLTTVVTAANLPIYLCCALALVAMWRRGQKPANRDLLYISVPGLAYVVFAFIGLGSEPFWYALALAAAGLPVYLLMRWQRGGAGAGAAAKP